LFRRRRCGIIAGSDRSIANQPAALLFKLAIAKGRIMAQRVIDSVVHAKESLQRSKIADLRQLEVAPDGERILLTGTVSSFYHKQLAQEVVRNCVAGREITNG
jgi:hypothetical protein